MSSDKLEQVTQGESPPELSSGAETKRRTARRKFLARGTAAGSGMLIVTLYHQRAYGGDKAKKVLVSSPETCRSIGGTPTGHEKQVKDSVTGHKVKRTECELP